MGDFSRTLGLGTLASLPLWLGMIGVILAARDLTEMAAAAIAAAVAITIAGVAALTIVTRRSTRIAREHDIYVRQSLALVDCMKEINRRVMQIEARKDPAQDVVETALAIETDLAPPLAMNDAPANDAPANDATANDAPTNEAPAAMAEAVPLALRTAMALPSPPPLVETAICHLANGEPRGVRLTLTGTIESDVEAVLLVVDIERRALDRLVEVMLPADATTRRLLLGALLAALPDASTLATGLTLGVSEPQLKAGGAEEMRLIAALVRAGARLCLHDVEDLELGGERLAASGIARVTMDAGWLTGRLAAEPDRVARWSTDLVTHGVSLSAVNIPHRRMGLLLAAFDVSLGSGPGAAAAAPAPEQAQPPTLEEPSLLPWRAPPRRKAG